MFYLELFKPWNILLIKKKYIKKLRKMNKIFFIKKAKYKKYGEYNTSRKTKFYYKWEKN